MSEEEIHFYRQIQIYPSRNNFTQTDKSWPKACRVLVTEDEQVFKNRRVKGGARGHIYDTFGCNKIFIK